MFVIHVNKLVVASEFRAFYPYFSPDVAGKLKDMVCMDKPKISRKQSKTSKPGHENQKSTKPKPQKPKP
ncbi:hypothetical protein Tco_0932043 [Tanacetum coccineum]